MNRAIILGVAVVGGVLAYRALSPAPARRPGSAFGRFLMRRMERVMAVLPENAPPKLVMSVLPQLREQNDQIVAMLAEQNALLHALLKDRPDASDKSHRSNG